MDITEIDVLAQAYSRLVINASSKQVAAKLLKLIEIVIDKESKKNG